jgi:hypothetical protein
MAEIWVIALQCRGTRWGIPAHIVADFTATVDRASSVFRAALLADRTAGITTTCQKVFGEVTRLMVFINSRYFKKPPLDDGDFTALFHSIAESSGADPWQNHREVE